MFILSKDWNPKQARLREIILKPDYYKEAQALALELHSCAHQSAVSGSVKPTFADEIFADVNEDCFRNPGYDKNTQPFAYHIWHLTRIEDICANILIAGGAQVINTENWAERLNSTITDTGNALTPGETLNFSRAIDMRGLFEYRIAVGKKTRALLSALSAADMKIKMKPERLQRIFDEKAVSTDGKAAWLVDFWGRKNIAGLILMPFTRHQTMHLNDCARIKKKAAAK